MTGSILAALALASFATYGYAMRSFFSRAHGVDPRMRGLQVAGSIFALLHVLTLASSTGIPLGNAVSSTALYAAGLALFWSACRATALTRLTLAFSADVPLLIVESGIYRHIRHPFYAAYTLTWMAGAVALPSWATTLSATLMVCLYSCAAAIEERKFLQSPLADRYVGYRRTAGAFWPRWPRKLSRRADAPLTVQKEAK